MSNPSATHVRLDFDRLVREYLDNLQVNLRGFKAAESFEFLDAWVLHDDPTENLIELVELAREAGFLRLTVLLSEATAAGLDMPHLEGVAGTPIRRYTPQGHEFEFALDAGRPARRPMPAIKTSPAGTATEPVPSLRNEPPEPARRTSAENGTRLIVHPCYRAALERLLSDVRHHRRPAPVAGLEELAVRHGDWELMAIVDLKTAVVKQAGFLGAGSPVERGLMEALCRAMEERPIQECADHGAIAVEYALRDKKQPPPVTGVVTPDNADPAFQLPQQIARRLLEEYRVRTGYAATLNFFDRPASPRWMKLSDEGRREVIEQALVVHGAAAHAQLVCLDGLKRVVVRFTSELTSHQKQELLVQLEADLRDSVEPTLQVTTQARADRNILRLPEQKK